MSLSLRAIPPRTMTLMKAKRPMPMLRSLKPFIASLPFMAAALTGCGVPVEEPQAADLPTGELDLPKDKWGTRLELAHFSANECEAIENEEQKKACESDPDFTQETPLIVSKFGPMTNVQRLLIGTNSALIGPTIESPDVPQMPKSGCFPGLINSQPATDENKCTKEEHPYENFDPLYEDFWACPYVPGHRIPLDIKYRVIIKEQMGGQLQKVVDFPQDPAYQPLGVTCNTDHAGATEINLAEYSQNGMPQWITLAYTFKVHPPKKSSDKDKDSYRTYVEVLAEIPEK